MKKLILGAVLAVFTLSIYSCRETNSEETTVETVEDDLDAEMEEMGLDIEVVIPTMGDTLSSSLGLTKDQHQEYKDSLEEEMEHHDGSCCFTNEEKKSVH